MAKTVIAPIIAFLAIAVQFIFGIEIPNELQEQIVYVIGNAIALGTIVYGIVKDHRAEAKRKKAEQINLK